MTPAIRWLPALCATLAGCGGGAPAPTPAAPPATAVAAPAAVPGPAAAPAPAQAPAPAPAAPNGLRADPAVVQLIGARTIGRAPTIADPFLPMMTRQFDPVPLGDWGKDPRVEAEVRRLATHLVDPDPERRADAAYALAELGPAVALFLDGALQTLRADAVARVDAMLADVKARLAKAGLTPEQVVWDPRFGQYEPTITTLIRDLIDGDAGLQAQAREALGEMDPTIVWMFHERPAREILMEPARGALLATQRRIWRTADVHQAAEWLALRLGATLWVDKAVLNEERAVLRDRDYVDPELVFDNLTGELLSDYTTYGPAAQRGYVVWRPAIPPAKPGEPARPIGAELAGDTTIAAAYRLVGHAGDFDVRLDGAVRPDAPAKFAIRTFDWVLFLFELAAQLGHEVHEHPDGGFLIKQKA